MKNRAKSLDESERHEGSKNVHYVDWVEYVSLLISRRRLERVWIRRDRWRAMVRDTRTGELYVARSMEPEPSTRPGTV